MSAAWVVQALVGALLLSLAGLAAERAADWLGYPVRGVWVVAMLATVALPALALVAPGLLPDLGILPDPPAAMAALDDAVAAPLPGLAGGMAGPASAPRGAPALATMLIAAWALVTVTLLAAVVWTYARFRRLRAGAERAVLDGVAVRVAERAGPAVMGLLRPEIVLPRWVLALPEEEWRLVLAHEREHLARRDALLLFAGTALVALMPWCFSLWWQHGRLRQAIETDCDARVLARGANRRDYGRILIRTASSTPGVPLLNPAWGATTSQLERRLMRMTAKRPRYPVLCAVPLVVLVLGVVATACDMAGRSPSDADLATSPPVERIDYVAVRASAPDPSLGDLGMQGMSWPEGSGPRFAAGGRVSPPTRHGTIDVFEGRAMWNAGLRDGDVLLSVNGRDTRSVAQPFLDRRPGTRYDVRVRRGGEEHEFTLEVGPSRS